jgi:hypothetical protein
VFCVQGPVKPGKFLVQLRESCSGVDLLQAIDVFSGPTLPAPFEHFTAGVLWVIRQTGFSQGAQIAPAG